MALAIVIAGALLIITLVVILFAAYKIKARTFECSTAIPKVFTFTIKISGPDGLLSETGGQRKHTTLTQGQVTKTAVRK
jgi:hypothetical protein